jgi:hypothetical protein
MTRLSITKDKCENEYEGAVVSYKVGVNGRYIGDLFGTREFGRGWQVVLCGRLGYSGAQFASEEGAMKYMVLVANATAETDTVDPWEPINEPPQPIDDGSCDPLYGQRMDSADMGEC